MDDAEGDVENLKSHMNNKVGDLSALKGDMRLRKWHGETPGDMDLRKHNLEVD